MFFWRNILEILKVIIQEPTVQYGYIQMEILGTIEEIVQARQELYKEINKKEEDII